MIAASLPLRTGVPEIPGLRLQLMETRIPAHCTAREKPVIRRENTRRRQTVCGYWGPARVSTLPSTYPQRSSCYPQAVHRRIYFAVAKFDRLQSVSARYHRNLRQLECACRHRYEQAPPWLWISPLPAARIGLLKLLPTCSQPKVLPVVRAAKLSRFSRWRGQRNGRCAAAPRDEPSA